MKSLMYLAMIFFVGCSTLPASDGSKPVNLVFHADSSFTAPERQSIDSAAKAWDAATGGLAKVTVTYDADDKVCAKDNCIHRLKSDSEEAQMADLEACLGLYPCVLGWTTHTIHEKTDTPIVLDLITDRADTQADLTEIVEHELGHALGIKHVPYRHALMYPGKNPEQKGCITQVDVSEYCRVNHCGSHKVNPCD